MTSIIDAIADWHRLEKNGIGTVADVDALCAATDAMTTWCDNNAAHLRKPIAAYKEIVLARVRGDYPVSDADLIRALNMARDTVQALERLIVKPASKTLPRRQREILQALHRLKAVSEKTQQPLSEVGKKAAPSIGWQSLKNPASALKKHGLVNAGRGAGSGYWLTPAGVHEVKQLNQRRPKTAKGH